VGAKIGADELSSNAKLAIAHLWSNHFVVVEASPGGMLKVTEVSKDPAVEVLMPAEEFGKIYSGFALLLSQEAADLPNLTPSSGPDLRVDNYMCDFGTVDEEEGLVHAFTCTNSGNEDLIISKVDSSCGCAVILPSQNIIASGAQATITVAVDTKRRPGPLAEIVLIQTNDKVTPIVQLNLQATVRPARVPLWPRAVNFGTLQIIESATRELYIARSLDQQLLVDKVVSDNPLISAELVEKNNENNMYVISIKLKPGAPQGNLNSTLLIYSNHPREPIARIPVSASIIGDISSSVKSIFFGQVKQGSVSCKELTLFTTDEKPFTITKIDSPCSYLNVNTKCGAADKRHVISVSISKQAPTGYTDERIVVHTDNCSQPDIEIPIYALVVGE
jgi:hypothetical protein